MAAAQANPRVVAASTSGLARETLLGKNNPTTHTSLPSTRDDIRWLDGLYFDVCQSRGAESSSAWNAATVRCVTPPLIRLCTIMGSPGRFVQYLDSLHSRPVNARRRLHLSCHVPDPPVCGDFWGTIMDVWCTCPISIVKRLFWLIRNRGPPSTAPTSTEDGQRLSEHPWSVSARTFP